MSPTSHRALRRLARLASVPVAVAAVVTALLTGPVAPGTTSTPRLQSAADLSQFSAGNIISDAVFFDASAMGAAEIQSFLAVKGASCTVGSDGTPCLKDYRQDTTSRAADGYCAGYTGAAGETAATIISKIATSCGINPQVLLVLLQKEQGLVTATSAAVSASRYRIATGFACPDTAPCDTAYYGLQNQLYSAARQFQRYAASPSSYQYRAGRTVTVLYNPNTACGSGQVAIANQATAGLYNYTPYQPNAAALRAGYGVGDACSSYGNRNFWLYFTDWFGSTQTPDEAATTMPKGNVDGSASSYGVITMGGWTFDPEAPTQALEVHMYIDGQFAAATVANQSRPDVGAAYPDAGADHGFVVSAPALLGPRQVCVYAINIGAGVVNPQLGCRIIDNEDAGAPRGSVESVVGHPGTIDVSGWAYDPDQPTAPIQVNVYVDGRWNSALTASDPRPDVGTAFGVGPAHGFHGSITASTGSHTVCLYAINVGLGSTNPQLSCAQVAVADPADYNPVGGIDTASASGGTLRISGWAYDPDAPAAPLAVHLYVDGSYATQVTTGVARPDIAASRPAAGPNTGFSFTTTLPAGKHQVCVFGINVGYGNWNPGLGCATVTTIGGSAANPIGALDVATGGAGILRVAGWAYDPDASTGPVTVHVYVDGAYAGAIDADLPRPDVGRLVTGAGDDHGFDWPGAASAGKHRVCVYGINVGAGNWNPQLGCATVTVTDTSPVGGLDDVTPATGTVAVSGWAYDVDSPRSPVMVNLWSDGTFLATVPASASRPDIGAMIYGAGPNRGFTWRGAVSAGQHAICAYAINVGPGASYSALGCRTVAVP